VRFAHRNQSGRHQTHDERQNIVARKKKVHNYYMSIPKYLLFSRKNSRAYRYRVYSSGRELLQTKVF
jgi:hypothetical protein